ncbi:MAG: hypothetical protein GXP48_01215 [Acidobacteria bacterium]|nr:hypothetical protein [Acidobacteriota bacterium]
MKRSTILVAGMLLAFAAGCGHPPGSVEKPGSAAAPGRGGTVVIGALSGINNWNPYLNETALGDDVLSLLYPTLAIEQVDYRAHPPSFTPNLASSWEFSPDHLTLTFHLRSSARWSDGTPVTSADVLFSYRTRISPEIGWESESLKKKIRSVDAPDAHTVRFHYTHRYPYQLMDANDGPIIPAHAWGSIPYAAWDRQDWRALALSAGPFELSSATPQQQFVLKRNPLYWKKGRPFLDRLIWRIVPDQGNLLTQLRTGEIDFMQGIPPRQAGQLRGDPHVRLIHFPDRSYGYIGWNTRRPLFRDPRVRRALTLALDRRTILDTVMRGYGRLAVGPVLSTMWAFDSRLVPYPYDPARARTLLAAAGWTDTDGDGILDRRGKRLAFELMTNAGNEIREDICQMAASQLARIGIKVSVRFIEWGTMLSRLEHGDFDAYISAWREGTQVDPAPLWHSAPPGAPTYNYVGYSNPEVDRLIDQLAATETAEAQKPLLDRFQEIVHRDQPYTFLYEGQRLDGINRRIRGAVINDATAYFNVDEWTVSSSRR